jgi:plastocyanin
VRGAAAAVAALGLLLPSAAAAKTFPTRVQVTAKEYYYTLSGVSGRTVKAGPAIIEFVNYGQDPHDMRVQRVGSAHVYGTPVLQPGNYYDLSVKLVPGKYELWCSIANHRQLGMAATLLVKPAPG